MPNETRVSGRAWTGLLLGCSTLALGAFAPVRASVPTGGAYISTLPGGAEVWLDGTYVGRSPILVDGIAAGTHAVSLTKAGWATTEIKVVVVGGGAVVMSGTQLAAGSRATGASEPGTLVLRDVPPGAAVALDDAPLDRIGRPLVLPAGPHRLAVTSGQGRTERTFTIFPATTTGLLLREPQGRKRSAVVAPAEDYLPTDAFVVDGNKIVVRYAGHLVVAHFGDATVRIDGAAATFDSAPESIGGKLYLPLELLEKLSGDVSKSP